MKLQAKARLQAVAGDPGAGATSSENWFTDGGNDPLVNDYQNLLIESCLCANCRPNLDQQPDMEPPVALLVSDNMELLLDVFEDGVTPPMQQQAGQVVGRRTQNWFHRLSSEQQREYCDKFPGTKFSHRVRPRAPKSNP